MSKQENVKPVETDNEEELQTARQEIFSYYRRLRSNLFSDTIIEYETKLTKEVFDLKLQQLSQDKKQSEFENFILVAASRLITPNIKPQTGPDGGGDGKVEAVVVKSAVEADSNDRYKMFVDIPASAMVVYKYEPYTDIEIKEIQIKNEAKAAKVEAEKRVDLARELADKAEEEAVRAANAEKEAKESLRLAQNARKEAEKKALEAVKESERIDEEMKLRLSQLKK